MSGTLLRILADASVRMSIVALLVGATLAALRVRASGMRHAAWTVVLLAMILMPVLTYAVPAISIPLALPFSSVMWSAETQPMAESGAHLRIEGPSVEATVRTTSTNPIAARSLWPVQTMTAPMQLPPRADATVRRWSPEKVLAILAHELAHIQRRDPLVSVVAHLNCLFWFHPLRRDPARHGARRERARRPAVVAGRRH